MGKNRYKQYLTALQGEYQKISRLDFLQPDGSIAFSLYGRGATGEWAVRKSEAFIQSGTLNVAMQDGQRRTATIELSNLDGEFDYNVNKVWYGQALRLSMGILLPDGSPFWLPQMVGVISSPSSVFAPNRRTVTFPLVDKWANLDGSLGGTLRYSYTVKAGENIFEVIRNILKMNRYNYSSQTQTPAGQEVDYATPIFTNYYDDLTYIVAGSDGSTTQEVSYLTTPYTITEEAGGNLANIILELNSMLNGLIGYDATGALRLDASQQNISDLNKPTLWTFSPTEKHLLSVSEQIGNTDVVNAVTVAGTGLSEQSVYGTAVNEDARSDASIQHIGERNLYETNSALWNEKQCQDYALKLLKDKSVIQKSISFSSAQLFHLQENGVIAIRRTDKKGSPVERHLINSFSLPIGESGQMTINATSIVDIPQFTIKQD